MRDSQRDRCSFARPVEARRGDVWVVDSRLLGAQWCNNTSGVFEAGLKTRVCASCLVARYRGAPCQATAWPLHRRILTAIAQVGV
ncbi:hypothetical protein WJX81_004994 [Elliptochloris bilobata]|uniref:MYND-type domain-containing protein n=1 Tax=Elliptochloris bilobata TaxID=381761 RepID=A0AAW1QXG5_9CHLO